MNNPQPLVSIITITFKAENTLPPTMQSLREQSCRNFEHIIIDGASTDNTISVARSLSSSPATRILSEPDNGIYDAMNKGLRMARGQYLLFLNAGDSFASPDSLRKFAEAASDNPDIIYADTMIVDDQRNILRPRHLSVPDRLTAESFSNGMLVCHQAFMVRRDIAPLYDTAYRLSADYDWTIRCIKAADPDKCINLHSPEIHYLDDGVSEKHKLQSLKERFRIMARHYGLPKTILRHAAFIPRAIKRSLQ